MTILFNWYKQYEPQFSTHTNFSPGPCINAVHVFMELRSVAIAISVVGRDKQVGMDHFMLQSKIMNAETDQEYFKAQVKHHRTIQVIYQV